MRESGKCENEKRNERRSNRLRANFLISIGTKKKKKKMRRNNVLKHYKNVLIDDVTSSYFLPERIDC